MTKVNITGIYVSNLSTEELLAGIGNMVRNHPGSLMLSGNVHSLNTAHRLPWFKEMMNTAELVRNDSAGLQLAGRILGTPLKDRMTWGDFGWDLARYCEKEKLTLYFLGNRPGIAERAKQTLQARHKDLQVTGTHHGYFQKEGEQNEEVIAEINRLNPDILIVGFGMPVQEEWILKNRDKLNAGMIMTGGNCFSFLAGEESRAPKWMHQNGLEWLHRLIKEPRRMFSRYVLGNPLFLSRVWLQKLGIKY